MQKGQKTREHIQNMGNRYKIKKERNSGCRINFFTMYAQHASPAPKPNLL